MTATTTPKATEAAKTTKTLAELIADFYAAGGTELTADLYEAFRAAAADAK